MSLDGLSDGLSVGLVGALAALPRRLAARAIEARGGELHRGVTRRTGMVVFGRRLLKNPDGVVEDRVAAARAPGRALRSENGFLRLLVGEAGEAVGLSRREMLERSGLGERELSLIALFDGFERDVEPFSFRDLILARKYAGLVAGGAEWGAIVRSVHRFGPAVSLTAKALQVGDGGIYARHADGVSELDGQMLLGLGEAGEDAEALFAEAEAAEAEGRAEAAAALYGRCLAVDPGDAVAAFNRANCLGATGRPAEAERELARALKLDPAFVEAWFNLAGLVAARGRVAAARGYLLRALELDPDYADAVFNLASLEFEAGDLAAARRWWLRYLELDPESEWGRRAARGVRFVELETARGAG
ncbi:tetratricopeptide repeat protein [Amaricoccus sp.]|uniref:tetratricopeptide repeat protein n=1 Tax=Amaricoccus sp. TaxID=1872485 RepID=UPI0026062CA1|nr:tetratricopeptide repeat protein [Amaricoccus sp.]HRO11684.1 tetratricopeptide repeat protein [Amaricoccus sp.]